MLKRVRQLFDNEAKKLKFMASTYRSGINIKFGRPYFDLLGQVTYGTSDGADWDKGVIMLDFPSYKPSIGDGLRYNEPFCTLREYMNMSSEANDGYRSQTGRNAD